MLKLVEAELHAGRGIADAYMIQFSLGYIPCIHAPVFVGSLHLHIDRYCYQMVDLEVKLLNDSILPSDHSTSRIR